MTKMMLAIANAVARSCSRVSSSDFCETNVADTYCCWMQLGR